MDKTVLRNNETELGQIRQLNPYLRIKTADNHYLRFTLSSERLVIGRDKKCDVVLSDEMISREHCVIWINQDYDIIITDLDSSNGTRVDGKKITQVKLSAKNRIKIGCHTLKIEFKDSEEIHQEELLAAAATTDALTGIANRKWFAEQVNQIFTKFEIDGQELAIIMLDIDHFKKVNDQFGHQMGDVVIKGVANILSQCKRQQDFLARFGGEEFILCLPHSSVDNTYQFCERVRKKIEQELFRFGKLTHSVTVSLGGCARKIDNTQNLDLMIKVADEALYQCKNNGRNCSRVGASQPSENQ